MTNSKNPLETSQILKAYQAGGGAQQSIQIRILPEIDSTNQSALQLGKEGLPEGTVVFAEKQNSGRGRLGRTWESPPGKNIYASILLRPTISPSAAPQITLVAGIACYEALEPIIRASTKDSGRPPLRLKWPNDLWVGRKKLGGILTEMDSQQNKVNFAVVGIGLNIDSSPEDFSETLRPIATSLFMETGERPSRSAIAGSLLRSFFKNYQDFLQKGFEPIREKWESYSKMKGVRVKVQENGRSFEGTCEGLDGQGFLLVKTSSGIETVIAGDVMWV